MTASILVITAMLGDFAMVFQAGPLDAQSCLLERKKNLLRSVMYLRFYPGIYFVQQAQFINKILSIFVLSG